MSEPKHTAGPWYQLNVNGAKGSGQMICTDVEPVIKFGKNKEYEHPFIVCQVGLYVSATCEQAEANAEYIVRACNSFPALLEALTVVRMSMGWQYMSDETKALIEAAIAKAQPEGD